VRVCACAYTCVSYIHNMYHIYTTCIHTHICIRSFLRYAIIAICNQTSVSLDSSTQISSNYKSNIPRPQTKTPCPLCVTHQNTRYVYIHVYIHVYIYTYICLRSNSKNPFRNQTILLSTPYPSKHASSARSQARRACSGRLAPTAHRPEPLDTTKIVCVRVGMRVCVCVRVCVRV